MAFYVRNMNLVKDNIRDKNHLCRYLRNSADFIEQDDDGNSQRRLHNLILTLQRYEKKIKTKE